MQDGNSERRRKRRGGRTGLFLSVAVLGSIACCIVVAGLWESYQRRTQMQSDPRVARVWVAGTTFGAKHQLQRGSSLQRWLNERHISLLGDYEQVQSQFANDRGSMEIWFNYESYLIGQPDLQCHRLNPDGTAFVDDLGQRYHGFLDIHGKTVGVYLPAYDHSAHEINCYLHWMPRRPASPEPVSRPMVFTVKVPPMPRVLPPASSLPRAVSVRQKGLTLTMDAARLGPFKQAAGSIGQRDLTFRLKIEGGEIANGNVGNDLNLGVPDPARAARIRVLAGAAPLSLRVTNPRNAAQAAQAQMLAFSNGTFELPMNITDPYGLPLIVPGQSVMPLVSKEMVESARRGKGMVWVAPVQGAGRGTDAIRIHIDVLPGVRPDHVWTGPAHSLRPGGAGADGR